MLEAYLLLCRMQLITFSKLEPNAAANLVQTKPLHVFTNCETLTANLSLCLYFALYNAAYASNYLLALFMGNLFLYLNYYVFMKLYCGERPTWTCLTYAALLHLTSIPSLYFFLQV